MISRVAENSFWLTRALERVKTTSKILCVNRNFLLDIHQIQNSKGWNSLLFVWDEQQQFEKYYPQLMPEQESESVQEYYTFNPENPSSIYHNLKLARDNARNIREILSWNMWESINSLWLWLNQQETQTLYKESRNIFYQNLIEQCQLFESLLQTTLRHDETHSFLNLGLMLERIYQLVKLIHLGQNTKNNVTVQEDAAFEQAKWLMLLKCVNGKEAFFKKSMQASSQEEIFDFLMFDKLFPQSAHFCLNKMVQFIQTLQPHSSLLKKIKELHASLFQEKSIEHSKEQSPYVALLLKNTQKIETMIQEEFFNAPLKKNTPLFETQRK